MILLVVNSNGGDTSGATAIRNRLKGYSASTISCGGNVRLSSGNSDPATGNSAVCCIRSGISASGKGDLGGRSGRARESYRIGNH